MKNYIIGIICAVGLVSCAQKQSTRFSLQGETTGVNSGKIYLQRFDNKIFRTVDVAEISDGKFKFTTDITLPEIYGLSLDTTRSSLLLFLEESPVYVKVDSTSWYQHSVVEGSSLHDLFTAYRNSKKENDIQISDFIRQNPTSLVSAYALYRDYSYRLSPQEIKDNIQLLDPSLHRTPYVQILNGLTETMEKVSVGTAAPVFTTITPDGKEIKLSDYLGNGYLLLDFWASWCGPCRKENPNLVEAYRKYNPKGFDILAVSLDKDKEAWIKAIEKDQLEWHHGSDLRYWESEPAALYGVRAIPANVLIGPDGNIVARNLKGEDLHTTLAELLKK